MENKLDTIIDLLKEISEKLDDGSISYDSEPYINKPFQFNSLYCSKCKMQVTDRCTYSGCPVLTQVGQ